MAGEVALQCQVAYPRMHVSAQTQVVYALMTVRVARGAGGVRLPLNLALVLDHSGSMHGAKLAAVKAAVQLVISRLTPDDVVSVVVFDDQVRVVVPAQPVRDQRYLATQIDGIRDGGGTAMSLGISAGLTEIHKYASPSRVQRMILLTDGVTYGDTSRCRKLADEARQVGIGIYPLGIGADWDEKLLDDLGERSGGSIAEFIRAPEDAVGKFERELERAESVTVTNTRLRVRLADGVLPRRAVKVLPLISEQDASGITGSEVSALLGDLGHDTPQAVLLELAVVPRHPGPSQLATVEVRYDAPGQGEQTVSGQISVDFTSDSVSPDEANAEVLNFVEMTSAHRLVTKVLNEYHATGKVTTKLHPQVTRVLDSQTRALLDQLQAGKSLSSGEVKEISNRTRKLTQNLE